MVGSVSPRSVADQSDQRHRSVWWQGLPVPGQGHQRGRDRSLQRLGVGGEVGNTAPGKPTVTGETPSAGAVSVAFTAPAQDGGSAITAYTAQCVSTDGGVSKSKVGGTTSPIAVTGLTLASTTSATSRPPTRSGPAPTAPTDHRAVPDQQHPCPAFDEPSAHGALRPRRVPPLSGWYTVSWLRTMMGVSQSRDVSRRLGTSSDPSDGRAQAAAESPSTPITRVTVWLAFPM